jgi:hypothetical protein
LTKSKLLTTQLSQSPPNAQSQFHDGFGSRWDGKEERRVTKLRQNQPGSLYGAFFVKGVPQGSYPISYPSVS